MDTVKDVEHAIAKLLKEKHNVNIVLQDNVPYALFHAIDVSRILNLKCVRTSLGNYVDTEKQILPFMTKGGLQSVNFLTMKGLKRLVGSSRVPKASELANTIGMEKCDYAIWSIEGSTLKCISDTFQNEEICFQHIVNNYRVDMYLPLYNLVIECDERHHLNATNANADAIRQKTIEDTLGCTFIRFQPHIVGFNIFEVLNKIYIHIREHIKN